ncbi:Phosphatidylserine/phosphatidylglycerophosphate/cardiolipin synthase [Duganella sp. CF402]|uniref:phospholipase D-like domain-containing protein n=1 Tax=unclassified Duganella TaxID=2636909 RepID=UPI0008AFA4AC|nr:MULTISPECIES: phospholipase D-like domain-containing protein [unclassified Duganella]RZT04096.1 phosphatidylserine/phosphatidylglycerophosphate/cardiolipin synthase-like enzyme [Duganella sp. BK701]SEM48423.1 Phosphatidylserine/phosphatidylglycerophosphate/cardiolipin synthase [Duganella sp. CF402]
MRRISISLLVSAALLSASARAEFSIPGYELVQTAPVETSLHSDDLRSAAQVWTEMFDNAKSEIVIGQFYAVVKPGSVFEKVVEHLEAAGKRGVKIRFLLDKKGVGLSEQPTIERLKAIPNLDLRILDFNKLTGNGIIHAKYLVVDGATAYIGSQNFDWRSFEHIHETGLRITDAKVVEQVLAIFNQDWRAQALTSAGQIAPVLNVRTATGDLHQHNFLLSSPNQYNPAGVGDSEAGLPALLAEAKNEVRIQLLDYAPLSYGPKGTRPYYAVIDNAVRAAAQRGVKIKLMVSNWNLEQPALAYLKSLAMLPNVEIRVVTLPVASSGFIPFARVIHSKTMVIDNQLAWIGTSNWAGGYMDLSRNLEVVLRNEKMAQRVAALHEQTWSSPYAQVLDINKQYPKPSKGSPE